MKLRHTERKGVRNFKAIDRTKDEAQGSEGLMTRNGKTVRNDSWLHPEVLRENKKK